MQRKARLNAIKTILKAATEGEKIKSVANRELEKNDISIRVDIAAEELNISSRTAYRYLTSKLSRTKRRYGF